MSGFFYPLAHMLVKYATSNDAAIVTTLTLIKILSGQQRRTLRGEKLNPVGNKILNFTVSNRTSVPIGNNL